MAGAAPAGRVHLRPDVIRGGRGEPARGARLRPGLDQDRALRRDWRLTAMTVEQADMKLDGNAIGGLLAEIFNMEMTSAEGTCGGCGAVNAVGRVDVYVNAPGTVVRCPACGQVLMRIVRGSGRTVLSPQPHVEDRPRALRAGETDETSHRLDELLRQRQPESGAVGSRCAGVEVGELDEDQLLPVGRDSRPGVDHG